MRCVVQKYGGSSVADLDKLRRVAERIAATWREGRPVVAVVSAMGNTTNELLALARQVSAKPDRRELDMLVSVGERISVALEGVFSGVPKVSDAVFVQGEKLVFDVSANGALGAFDDSAATPASGDITGGAIAWVAGANLETTCTIKLTPGNTTVTA